MITYFYKIVCKDPSIKDCYVGRTSNFKKRKAVHKNNVCKGKGTPLYKCIFSNGGWDNFEMLVFDVSSSDSASKLQKLEKQYIENYGCNLNIHVPGRTIKQYYEDNHDKRKHEMKQYYYNNREKCRDLMKQNYLKRKSERMELAETVPFEVIEG
jgi:hypothetical protein